jgi:hypothetical protein
MEMDRKITKSSSQLDFLNARLDEIQMSGYERLRAKASLARAEAVVEAVAGFLDLVRRFLKAPVVIRPARHPANSAG